MSLTKLPIFSTSVTVIVARDMRQIIALGSLYFQEFLQSSEIDEKVGSLRPARTPYVLHSR